VRLGFYELGVVTIPTNITIKSKFEPDVVTVIYKISSEGLHVRSPLQRFAAFYTFLSSRHLLGLAFWIAAHNYKPGIAERAIIIQESLFSATGTVGF
jgi:hypothetical protein